MLKPLLAGLALALATPLYAADQPAQPDMARLNALLQGNKPDSVQPSSIPGLYEVVIGSQLFYLSADGRFAMRGDIIDLDTQQNLTEARSNGLRAKVVNAVPESDMIVYTPEGKTRHTITVFTDIDCPYCSKLHSEMDRYLRAGIKVRYLAYPRSGLAGESYRKAVNVWCAADRKTAMTQAKAGQKLPAANCDNPVAREFNLGNQIGVQGTPAIVLESGEMVPGYVPAEKLAQLLDAPGQ
ncbi:DsbC family protein [Plasticicumulans acidivorans]|uniref:Thiol:disulfide interchange protein n=1 Tax=Plasticicumulans acidivorans TaxID=886464 RepID=A0A317MRU4_9GAMM|nr:DsbC family protein [Plasticicumulans acidivorans]PWV59288.1 thiol:disulfide interchange protein DsbC [Plasticicumulans acidivorans]